MEKLLTDTHGGDGIAYVPLGPYKYVLVFLHGLGDSGAGWTDMCKVLQRRQGVFLQMKYILPSASRRPITLNMGMTMPGWADIAELDPYTAEDGAGYSDARNRINKIITGEMDNGILPCNIILGGFSQGGAVAYYTGLSYSQKLAGLVVLSGWTPLTRTPQTDVDPTHALDINPAAKTVPILHCHGRNDPLVRYEWGEESANWVRQRNSADVMFKTFGYGHTADDETFAIVGDFIKQQIEKSDKPSQDRQ